MLQVTATDFKSNLGKYFSLVNQEEISITKNGVEFAVLTAPKPHRSVIDDLIGVIDDDGLSVKQLREERRKTLSIRRCPQ
jgi:prevent-host-death family protein